MKNFLEVGRPCLANGGERVGKRTNSGMEEKHTPEVFPSRKESDFVDGDLISGGYGSRSLAWPHGQRTPPCYLAQHFECVVEEGLEGCSWWKGTPGRAAGAEEKDRASKLAMAGSQRLLRPSLLCHPALAGSSSSHKNSSVIKGETGSPVVCFAPATTTK